MKLLNKVSIVSGLMGLTTLPLYAHSGSHPVNLIDTVVHFFTSAMHLRMIAVALVLILALIIYRAIAK